jgi:hypothetical protein
MRFKQYASMDQSNDSIDTPDAYAALPLWLATIGQR